MTTFLFAAACTSPTSSKLFFIEYDDSPNPDITLVIPLPLAGGGPRGLDVAVFSEAFCDLGRLTMILTLTLTLASTLTLA